MERLGAVAKCAPPLRSDAERESLWRALKEGDINIVASDHSPSSPDLKKDPDFFQVWGGIAGVQSTLAVLLEAGHHQRGLPLQNIAALTAAAPAKRFRIANKGSIQVGFDADCTLVDLDAPFALEAGGLLTRHPLSPYLGSSFRGMVRRTISRGETIFQDGRITSSRPGRMVRPGKDNRCKD
jgi:allantoinase